MKIFRTQLKKLSLAVATVLLLASVVLSLHFHSDVKTAEKGSSCSVCQISQSLTKFLQPSVSLGIIPQVFTDRISLPQLFRSSPDKVSIVWIRGPPVHPSN
jgi:hypothetical protein